MLRKMVAPEEIAVEPTTAQQARMAPSRDGGELPDPAYRVEAVAAISAGSAVAVGATVRVGRASSYLAAVGAAVLGDVQFDDDSLDAITEARLLR